MQTFNHPRHGNILVTDHVKYLIDKDVSESCPQRTEEWYAKRDNHLTASAFATACGENPYETRMTLLKRKTGREKAFKGNEATAHGNKYEFEAILKYEQSTGHKVLEFGLLESMNEGEEFLAGSPDGITSSGRLIEVKCPLRRKPTHVVPEHYRFQVMGLMRMLRLTVCDFIQYVPASMWKDETFIVTTVEYDPYFWQAKFPKMRRFWDEVLEVRQAIAQGTFEESDAEDDESAGEPPAEGKVITVAEGVRCDLDFALALPRPSSPEGMEVDESSTGASGLAGPAGAAGPDGSAAWLAQTDFFQFLDNKQESLN